MTSTGASGAARQGAGGLAVSTTDLVKAAGLLLILFDHWAYYVQPELDWMHAIGRGALPLFFFLIGFASARRVPPFWIIAGLGLTALDGWHAGGAFGAVNLNILISFALVRWALPLVERHVLASPWRLAAFVLALVAIAWPAGEVIDYGSAGWLLALVGLLHRRALAGGPDHARAPAWLARRLVGAVAALIFVGLEIHDYGFATEGRLVPDAYIAAASIIFASGALLRFRRVDLAWRPPSWLGAILRLCGRRSLEIYILQILGLMAVGVALGVEPDTDGTDEPDDADEEG